jgi:thiol-disulfide isomerase/thioredoxin
MRRWRYLPLVVLGLALIAGGILGVRRWAPFGGWWHGDDEARADSGSAESLSESSEVASHLFVLAINGGGSPGQNYKSHLMHLQGVVDLLHTAGVPSDHITVLSGDGGDPGLDLVERSVDLGSEDWRLYGTELEDYFSHLAVAGNSAVSGANLYPATRGSLSVWLITAGQQLHQGDTLLLYVTDHGALGAQPEGNRIVLWGAEQSLSVRELGDMLDTLDPEVRVVALMSQCYSGGFARLAGVGGAGKPTGRFCGFFSTTADQKSYGCYPETRDKPKVGHSFAFLQALPAATGRLSVAHELAQEFDDTPDVPVSTSELYLEEILAEAARTRRMGAAQLVDDILQSAWRRSSELYLQTQRLDRLSDRFGLPTIRSRFDLARVTASIQEALTQLGPFSVALGKSLAETNRGELRRFLAIRSDLRLALAPAALKSMDLEQRVRIGKYLLYDLSAFSGGRAPAVKQDRDAISGLLFRMRVRMAALARIQTALDAIAGERYLAERPAARAAMQKLVECEAFDLRLPGAEWVPPGPALVPLDQDLLQLGNIVARGPAGGLLKQQATRVGEQVSELHLVPYRGEIPVAGTPVLLFFWATWCEACKHVVPSLMTWAQRRHLPVLAITDEDASALDQFFALPRDFPALVSRDPDHQTQSRFGVRNLPSFVLLNSQGKMASPLTSWLRELPAEMAQ